MILFRNLKLIILFIPFIIFSYLTINYGIRFIIYVAPFIYFGFFYSLKNFFLFVKNNLGIKIIKIEIFACVLTILFIWNYYFPVLSTIQPSNYHKTIIKPYFQKEIVQGLVKVGSLSDNYKIYSAWDYKHLIKYYTRSKEHISHGTAYSNSLNFYQIFFSDENILKIINEATDYKDADSFVVFTNDFIKWWPTINNAYSKENMSKSQILTFSCTQEKNTLNCSSRDGTTAQINLLNGELGNSSLLYKIIINNGENSYEKVYNEKGNLTIVYSPELEKNNMHAIFPKKNSNKNFIKYFFSPNKSNDDNLILVDSFWPYYRTYKIVNKK